MCAVVHWAPRATYTDECVIMTKRLVRAHNTVETATNYLKLMVLTLNTRVDVFFYARKQIELSSICMQCSLLLVWLCGKERMQ